MSEEAFSTPEKQFAADMRRLREARGLSIEDVHRKTKIPPALIESFETDGLVEHPMFNRVYLRSFVRAYAALVGLPADRALGALDRALGGQYEGELTEDVLASASAWEETPEAQPEAPEAGEPPSTGEPPNTQNPAPSETERAPDGSAPQRSNAAAPSSEEASEAASEAAEEASEESATRPEAESQPAPPEEAAGTAWTQQSPPSGGAQDGPPQRAPSRRTTGSDARRRSSEGRPLALKAALAVSVLALLGVGAFLLFGPEGESDAEANLAPADTSAAPAPAARTVSPPDREPPADLELGETLRLTLLAEGGNVQGIRLTRDSDLRRPYWIEQGAATTFPFQDRVVVERDEQIAKARLFLEGYPYPKTRRDDEGRIVIDRPAAQAFADTLRGAPAALSVTPDTNRIPVPR